MKDTQGALRYTSIQTSGDVYMQLIEGSVLQTLNYRMSKILSGWKPMLLSRGQPINGESAAPKKKERKSREGFGTK
jgi:hypothetical protein